MSWYDFLSHPHAETRMTMVPQEAVLPHSPRAMAFFDHSTISVAYSPTEYAVFSIEKLTAIDVALPSQATTSMAGMGAFAGLTGYMTLGLGTKPRSAVLRLSDTEALVAKDSELMNRGIIILCLKHEFCRSSVYNWGRRQTDKTRCF
jgi:hypothetical protein